MKVVFSLDQIMTPEAKAALRREQREKHRGKAIAFLKKAYPETTAGLENVELDAFVQLAHQQVDQGRLRSERSVLNHLIAMMVLGTDFQMDPMHTALIERRVAEGGAMPPLGGHAILTYVDDWAEWCRVDAADPRDLAARIEAQTGRLAPDAGPTEIAEIVSVCLPKRCEILRYHKLFDARIEMDVRRFGARAASAGDLCAMFVASLHLGHHFDANPIYRSALPNLEAGTIAQCIRDVPAAYLPQEPGND